MPVLSAAAGGSTGVPPLPPRVVGAPPSAGREPPTPVAMPAPCVAAATIVTSLAARGQSAIPAQRLAAGRHLPEDATDLHPRPGGELPRSGSRCVAPRRRAAGRSRRRCRMRRTRCSPGVTRPLEGTACHDETSLVRLAGPPSRKPRGGGLARTPQPQRRFGDAEAQHPRLRRSRSASSTSSPRRSVPGIGGEADEDACRGVLHHRGARLDEPRRERDDAADAQPGPGRRRPRRGDRHQRRGRRRGRRRKQSGSGARWH